MRYLIDLLIGIVMISLAYKVVSIIPKELTLKDIECTSCHVPDRTTYYKYTRSLQ